MNDHERTIVREAISHMAEQTRSAQRCIEVLANLFESMRRELYPQQASRLWYVLNQIPNLQRVPLYPTDSESKWPSGPGNHYRWHFMEHAMPAYNLRHMADLVDELSELLSGQKIEDVAQSNGHEAYMEYMGRYAGIPRAVPVSQPAMDAIKAAADSLPQMDSPERKDAFKNMPNVDTDGDYLFGGPK
jgi:hypothetical protein